MCLMLFTLAMMSLAEVVITVLAEKLRAATTLL